MYVILVGILMFHPSRRLVSLSFCEIHLCGFFGSWLDLASASYISQFFTLYNHTTPPTNINSLRSAPTEENLRQGEAKRRKILSDSFEWYCFKLFISWLSNAVCKICSYIFGVTYLGLAYCYEIRWYFSYYSLFNSFLEWYMYMLKIDIRILYSLLNNKP